MPLYMYVCMHYVADFYIVPLKNMLFCDSMCRLPVLVHIVCMFASISVFVHTQSYSGVLF